MQMEQIDISDIQIELDTRDDIPQHDLYTNETTGNEVFRFLWR